MISSQELWESNLQSTWQGGCVTAAEDTWGTEGLAHMGHSVCCSSEACHAGNVLNLALVA